jgi:hypothetical protein
MLPYTVFVWMMFLILTLLAPLMKHQLPQPWWALGLFGSWALMVWAMRSKERWFE